MALRKIRSEREIEQKKKRVQLVAVIVMASLLLLSTVGYFASEMFGGNSEESISRISYGGKVYLKQNDLWILQNEARPFYFFNLPNESRGIYLNESSFSDYSNKPLYIVNANPGVEIVLLNLEGTYSRWQTACLEADKCEENQPLKNCSDNVIAFVESELEGDYVERKENCIFIYGNSEKGIDAFSYNLLGIK